MIHVRLRCSEHRLLHRCPMRNLLINNTVYVSGRTSLCRGGKKRWRLRVKDGDGDGGEEGGAGGVTQFSRELIEHDSNKNKMLGPSAWAVTGSVEQNFSVTLQGSDTIFDFSFSFFFFGSFAKCQLVYFHWFQKVKCAVVCRRAIFPPLTHISVIQRAAL